VAGNRRDAAIDRRNRRGGDRIAQPASASRMSLILASGSATRQRLLKNAGVQFSVDAANVDEEAAIESLIAEKATARDIADFLAELKAIKVSTRHPTAFVLGADQTLGFDKETLQKPRSLSEAEAQLKRLRGRQHKLFSAVAIAREGSVVWRAMGEATLTMRMFSNEFLTAYLGETGEDILGSVGAYHVEGLGIQLFSRIDGDQFTIMGLPLVPVLDFLRTHGILRA
jgi:septum formation protein